MSDPDRCHTPHWESPQAELGRLQLLVLASVLVVAALLLLLLGWLLDPRLLWLLLPLGMLGTAIAWYVRASLRRYRFALLDDGVLLRKGLCWHSEVFVPRVRIQHTDVSQGPLARRLQLATLVLHTAGVNQARLDIAGLRPQRARQLRDELLQRQSNTQAMPAERPA